MMISAFALKALVIPAIGLAAAAPVILIWLVWRDSKGGRLW
ncbi:hypothetical protein [Yunchengibacter salinarum]